MPTIRETILQALLAALQTVPDATIMREKVLPERVPADGLLILRDGDPGTPEVTLSPLAYHYEHRAEIEVIVQGKTPAARATAFDTLVQGIGAVLATNRTLGGLCDWTEAQAPHAHLDTKGGKCEFAAICTNDRGADLATFLGNAPMSASGQPCNKRSFLNGVVGESSPT